MIIIPWNKSVKSYADLGEDVPYLRPDFCPDCDHPRLTFRGKYTRWVIDGKVARQVYVRLIQCQGCGSSHAALLSFLFKYQVESAKTIIRALYLVFELNWSARKVARLLRVSRPAIGRWIKRFETNGADWYRYLSDLYRRLFPGAPHSRAKGYPAAVLDIGRRLFISQTGKRFGSYRFSSYLAPATKGNLLVCFEKPPP